MKIGILLQAGETSLRSFRGRRGSVNVCMFVRTQHHRSRASQIALEPKMSGYGHRDSWKVT